VCEMEVHTGIQIFGVDTAIAAPAPAPPSSTPAASMHMHRTRHPDPTTMHAVESTRRYTHRRKPVLGSNTPA